MRKFTEIGVKPDYLSFPMLSFFIRFNIIVSIFKSMITTIITTIVVGDVAVFSNFIIICSTEKTFKHFFLSIM